MKNLRLAKIYNPFASCRAFTFTEMLLVVSLVSIISLALFNSFADGIKIWDRAQQLRGEEDVLIFIEKLNRDVQNAFEYSLMPPFKGKKDEVVFPAIVRILGDGASPMKGQYIDQVGRVRYHFDRFHHNLIREQANYSQALKNHFGASQVLVSSVRAINFKYYFQTPFGYEWKNKYEGPTPVSLYIEILFGNREESKKIKSVINFPLGI